MARSGDHDPEARRAYRQQLRAVARLLRWTGAALVLLGAVGIALGHSGAWFIGPSWFSLLLGWVLVISGVVRRQPRTNPVEPDE